MDGSIVSNGASGSDMLAWGGLAIAALALLLTAYWNRRSEKRLFLDEFWFRQVVAPKCIAPVIEFHDGWLAKVDSLDASDTDAKSLQALMSELQRTRLTIEHSAWITRIFSGTYYVEACRTLDLVEDSFAQELLVGVLGKGNNLSVAKSAIKASLSDSAVHILAIAATIHGGNLKPAVAGRPKRLWQRVLGRIAGYESK